MQSLQKRGRGFQGPLVSPQPPGRCHRRREGPPREPLRLQELLGRPDPHRPPSSPSLRDPCPDGQPHPGPGGLGGAPGEGLQFRVSICPHVRHRGPGRASDEMVRGWGRGEVCRGLGRASSKGRRGQHAGTVGGQDAPTHAAVGTWGCPDRAGKAGCSEWQATPLRAPRVYVAAVALRRQGVDRRERARQHFPGGCGDSRPRSGARSPRASAGPPQAHSVAGPRATEDTNRGDRGARPACGRRQTRGRFKAKSTEVTSQPGLAR